MTTGIKLAAAGCIVCGIAAGMYWSGRDSGQSVEANAVAGVHPQANLVLTGAVLVPASEPSSVKVQLEELMLAQDSQTPGVFRDAVNRIPVAEIHRLIWHCLAPGNIGHLGETAKQLLTAMAEWDPYGAMELAWRISDRQLGINIRNAIMYEWGLQDPKAALAYVATMPDIPLRWGLGYHAVKAWATYANEDAFRYLSQIGFEEGGRLIHWSARHLDVRDLDAIFTYAEGAGDRFTYAAILSSLIEKVPDITGEEILQVAEEFLDYPEIRRSMLGKAGKYYAGERLQEGLALLGTFENHSMNDHFALGLSNQQAKVDLTALLDATSANFEDYWHARIYHFRIKDSVPAQLDAVFDFLESMPAISRVLHNPQCQACVSISEGLAERSMESSYQWIRELDDWRDKAAAILGMSRAIKTEDIPVASEFISQVPPEMRLRVGSGRNLLRVWKQLDEPAARAWAQRYGYEFPE